MRVILLLEYQYWNQMLNCGIYLSYQSTTVKLIRYFIFILYMHPEQSHSTQQPKTPSKPRSNALADGLRFIVSEQKPRNIDMIDSIFEDTPHDNIILFSQTKYDPSQQDQQSYSPNSIDSSQSESQKSYLQQEKFLTVKKLFEPKLAQIQAKYLTTARTNTKGCNCDKSKCQKNYCICFKMGNTCSADCECIDCQNHQFTQSHRKNQKIAFELLSNAKQKGCNCKNSNCLKNYCICHQNGRKCSKICRCQNCHNLDEKNNDGQDDQKGVMRLMFTARKKVKVSQFDQGQDKQNIEMNV